MGYFVPEALRSRRQWLVQRGKIPFDPKTGRKASSTNPAQWGSYEEAQARFNYGDFEGLGFVFSAEDDLVFIDLDKCISEDGEMTSFAEEVLAMFPDTYTEVSVSETGLHIVCRGQIRKAIKRKEIEIYSCGRYMAFTGNAICPVEPQNAQKAIDTLCSRYALTEPSEAVKTAFKSAGRTPEEVIAIIQRSRQAEKFNLLFAGNWQGLYNSNSEADQAFINIVNYFANGEDALTMAVFARSRLSERAKGKRADYIAGMIQKAKATATGSKTKGNAKREGLTDYEPKQSRRKSLLSL